MSNYDRYRGAINDLPLPEDNAGIELRGSKWGVSLTGTWHEKDILAQTDEIPVVNPDDTLPHPTVPGGPTPRRAEIRYHEDGTPVWEPSYARKYANELPLWQRFVRAGKRLAAVAVLVTVGGVAGALATGISQHAGPSHPTAKTAPYTPIPGHTPTLTPTTQPTPKVKQPTPTPNQQPPTQTPPTPTTQPPTPVPKTGPQPEYVVKSDGSLSKDDTVFAQCRSGTGANETYTVNGQQYSSSDFQNPNDTNLPQC